MNYLDITKVKDYRGTNFHIVPQGSTVYFYSDENGFYNDRDYVNNFTKKLLDIKITSGNILVVGLGIGSIANWLSYVCPFVNIDVVDNNSELVSVVKSMDYLKSKIKIFNHNIFDFIPSKKYDAIILDIWWYEDENTITEIQSLREYLNPYLKSNSKIYTPLFEPSSYEKL